MQFQYIVFYKPYQVLSQFSPEGDKKTLADYLPGIDKDIYPVGRLDYDSEGLLLLTNDKQLKHQLTEPRFAHKRTYWVQVDGDINEEAIAQLEKGVTISVDGKQHFTQPATAHKIVEEPIVPPRNPPIRYRASIPATWLSLTLTEGKNRQVRKMTAAVGFPTLRLIRYSIDKLTIDDLQPGQHKVFGKEIKQLLLVK